MEKTAEKIRIETCCGIFVYEPSEVEKTETINQPLPGYLKEKGYYNYTSMGFLVGSDNNDKQAIFSFIMEHNYQFNTSWAAGGFMGIEFFNEPVSPMGLNVKGMVPLDGKTSLFANFSAGYSIPLEKATSDIYYEYTDTKGGINCASELGFIFPSKSNVNLFMAFGYRYNEMNYVRNDWYYGNVDRKISYNRFVCKLGMTFH